MAFTYKPGSLTTALSSISDPNPALGGGLLTGLLAGLKSYGQVRGARERREQQGQYNKALSGINPMVAQRQYGKASQAIRGLDPELELQLARDQAAEDKWREEQGFKTKRSVILSPKGNIGNEYRTTKLEEARQSNLGKTIDAGIKGAKTRLGTFERAGQLIEGGLETGSKFLIPGSETVLSATNPDVGEFRSLQNKMIPAMRQPGSGPMSDKDAEMYKSAGISLTAPAETNRRVINAGIAKEKNELDYNDFIVQANASGMHTAEADKKWKEYQNENPILDPNNPGEFELNKNRTSWQDYFMGSGKQNKSQAKGSVDDFLAEF